MSSAIGSIRVHRSDLPSTRRGRCSGTPGPASREAHAGGSRAVVFRKGIDVGILMSVVQAGSRRPEVRVAVATADEGSDHRSSRRLPASCEADPAVGIWCEDG
jgi:hypothetical protein